MKNFQYTIAKIVSKLRCEKHTESIINYFRKKGIEIGKDCHIYSDIVTSEPFLIHIGNHVTISTEVLFVTHDNSICIIDESKPNLFGHICIGNDSFIGERAMIMYGCSLPNRCIVAAGSVVTNSFEREGIIVGGVPAKIIGTWEEFYNRNKNKSISRYDIETVAKENSEKLIKRKCK